AVSCGNVDMARVFLSELGLVDPVLPGKWHDASGVVSSMADRYHDGFPPIAIAVETSNLPMVTLLLNHQSVRNSVLNNITYPKHDFHAVLTESALGPSDPQPYGFSILCGAAYVAAIGSGAALEVLKLLWEVVGSGYVQSIMTTN